MDYTYRTKRANDIPDNDIPLDIIVKQQAETITQQGYTIASLQTEVAQLKRAIKELETEHKAIDFVVIQGEPDGTPWNGTAQTW